MIIRIIREPSSTISTLGVVFVDDVFQCFSLEDPLREVAGKPVAAWKVPGETAIPAGRYRVVLSLSPRFKRVLPEVLKVPGFAGVRIHPGNTASDTEGCILLGAERDGATIRDSRRMCDLVQQRIGDAALRGEPTYLLLENPLSY